LAEQSSQSCHIPGRQVAIAYGRDNQIPDQCISLCYCILDTTWVSASGDVQLRGNELARQY